MSTKLPRRKFLDELCKIFELTNPRDARRNDARNYAAQAFMNYGEKQCRKWLAEADGNYDAWERLVQAAPTRTTDRGSSVADHKVNGKRKSKSHRKAESRRRKVAKQAEALRRIARFTEGHQGKDSLKATIRNIDSETELAILVKQLEKAKSNGDRASKFKQDSLREQIALLKAQIKSPKV